MFSMNTLVIGLFTLSQLWLKLNKNKVQEYSLSRNYQAGQSDSYLRIGFQDGSTPMLYPPLWLLGCWFSLRFHGCWLFQSYCGLGDVIGIGWIPKLALFTCNHLFSFNKWSNYWNYVFNIKSSNEVDSDHFWHCLIVDFWRTLPLPLKKSSLQCYFDTVNSVLSLTLHKSQ